MTIGDSDLRNELKQVDAYYVDLFESFLSPLGKEISEMPLTRPGVSHSITGSNYGNRMEAINFALGHDDGMTHSCLLYTSPSPRDATLSRMPSSA